MTAMPTSISVNFNFLRSIHDTLARFHLNNAQRAALWAAIDPERNPHLRDGGKLADVARHPANRALVERYRRAAEIPLAVIGGKKRPPEEVKTLDDLVGDRALAGWETIATALARYAQGEVANS